MNQERQISFFIIVITFVCFLMLTLIGCITYYLISARDEHRAKDAASAIVQSYIVEMESTVNQNIAATAALADFIRFNEGSEESFESYADLLLERYPSIDHFTLIPNGIITNIYPGEGHETAIGVNVFDHESLRRGALRDLLLKTMSITAPVILLNGEAAFRTRLAVSIAGETLQDSFWGFVGASMSVSRFLEQSKLPELANYELEFQLVEHRREEETAVVTQSNGFVGEQSLQFEVPISGVNWTLNVAPSNGWASSHKTFFLVLVISTLVLISTGLCYLTIRKFFERSEQARMVELKTIEANALLQRLSNTLAAIPDYLVEVDENGFITENHYSVEKKLMKWLPLYPGEHISDCLDESAVSIWEDAMKGARWEGASLGMCFNIEIGDEEKWFELSAVYTKINDQHGTDAFFLFLVRDVTEHIKNEAELRVAAVAFETRDAIMITDKHNRIIRVNRAFQRVTGYREEEVFGKNPAVISSGRHGRNFFSAMYQSLQENGNWEGEVWNRRKDGTVFLESLYISTITDQQGDLLHYVAMFRDITISQDSQERLEQLNHYDELTRLANKTLLVEELDHRLQLMKEVDHRRSALLYLDLDNFKDFNDIYGHKQGDDLLQQVASRLTDVVRTQDKIARFSGDNFVLLLEDVDVSTNPERALYRAKHVANKLLNELKYPFSVDGKALNVTASIGITEFKFDKELASEDIIKQAEMAMYEAKQQGRARACCYVPKMRERVLERAHLESRLKEALAKKQYLLHYQPQFDADKKLKGFEALIRWNDPERGLVYPGDFIPFAEESRLITRIGAWVLVEACRVKANWQRTGIFGEITLSINVSALQFAQDNFVAQVKHALEQSDVNPNDIELELTESMLVDDQEDVVQKMHALKKLGVLITLDDFGTGYSSLSYLTRLPIDRLKIDRSFVSSLSEGTREATIASSIINIGHNLNMEVVAEGVEQENQFEWLKSQGCDLFQGYVLAKPLPESIILERFVEACSSH